MTEKERKRKKNIKINLLLEYLKLLNQINKPDRLDKVLNRIEKEMEL